MRRQKPLITAHRGLSGRYPENTLLAFSQALEFGPDFIETDLWRTKDGVLVCIHDENLKRTTDREGDVPEMLFEEVRQARCAEGEKVPSLQEALDVIGGAATLSIEIKMAGVEDQVLATVRAHPTMRLRCTIDSFNSDVVRRARSLAPELAGEWITSPGQPLEGQSALEAVLRALQVNATVLSVAHGATTEELVYQAHLRGLAVCAWTVNDEARMLELAGMGVDRITTNRCDLAASLLRR